MSDCKTHENHDHIHGEGCGHSKVKHGDHYDYLHDGHLHHNHEGHVDEHTIEVSDTNPNGCHQTHKCDHVHGVDSSTQKTYSNLHFDSITI